MMGVLRKPLLLFGNTLTALFATPYVLLVRSANWNKSVLSYRFQKRRHRHHPIDEDYSETGESNRSSRGAFVFFALPHALDAEVTVQE